MLYGNYRSWYLQVSFYGIHSSRWVMIWLLKKKLELQKPNKQLCPQRALPYPCRALFDKIHNKKRGKKHEITIQSDDYGITPAVSDGIIYGITHGVGATAHFPTCHGQKNVWKRFALTWNDIALGIDLNASTGKSMAYEKVPNLCH